MRRLAVEVSLWMAFVPALVASTNGCASALKNAHTTALDGVDLVAMTDDMAGRIAVDPRVNAAIAGQGRLKIVVMPVVNKLRAEVIPAGAAHAFTGRVRVLLARHSPERFTWVMNRDAFYDLRARERSIDAGPDPATVQPEYALTAIFNSLTEEDRRKREAFYVCLFELTDLRDRTILWTGSYEIAKNVVKDFLD